MSYSLSETRSENALCRRDAAAVMHIVVILNTLQYEQTGKPDWSVLRTPVLCVCADNVVDTLKATAV